MIITSGATVIEVSVDSRMVSEVISEHLCHKFESANASVVDAKKKVGYYIAALPSSSEEAKKVILQKLTRPQWHALLAALEKCVVDFDQYLSLINSGLDSHKKLMDLYAGKGNVDGTFLEISGKVLELFMSVPTGIEKQMKDITEIMEKLGIRSPLEES